MIAVFILTTITFGDQKGITLEEYLRVILKSNPEIQEAEYGIQTMQGYLEQVEGAAYPRISVLALAAPIPQITGNALNSDVNWSKWGPLLRGEIDVQLPLYTFGRIPYGREAAINGIKVEQAKVNEVRQQVIYRTKEIFYGHLFAHSMYQNVVIFAEEELNKALEYAEEEYDLGSGKVSKGDIGRLRVAQAELLKKKAEAEKYLNITKSALATFIGKDPKQFQIKLKEIEPAKFQIKPFDNYMKIALRNNPQWNQLKYGIKARANLYKFEKSHQYPILFLAGRLVGSYAPHISNQSSVFANDSYNEFYGGIALGIKWDFDFGQSGKIKIAKSEYNKLIEKRKFAQKGIYLLIKQTYLELVEAQKNIETNYKAYRAALSWLGFAFLAFESGTGEAKDALEGLAATASTYGNYYESIFKFNMTTAKMSQFLNEELTELKY